MTSVSLEITIDGNTRRFWMGTKEHEIYIYNNNDDLVSLLKEQLEKMLDEFETDRNSVKKTSKNSF